MKNYTVTVNGVAYDVTVEEGSTGGFSAPVASAPVAPKAPVQAPAPVKEAAPAPVASGAAGSVKVTSPMPGKILSVKAKVGDSVKKGQTVLVLEAMKMENDIVAPEDGTISQILTKEGADVEAGAVLATMN